MLLKDIIEFKNGKKKPSSKGNIPIYGGNGILDYTDQNNQDGESLIIGRVGAYCGSVYSHCGKCWISDNAIVGKVKEGNDFYYCYYLLKRLNLNSRHVGSGQPLMTQEILNNIEVNPCNYKIQQKIGKILKNIDDEIDMNNAINNNLHELVNSLYLEYVSSLDENNSSKIEIKNMAKCILGGTPSRTKSEYWNGNINWINSGEINKFRIIEASEYITDLGLSKSSTTLLPRETTVLAITGATLGQVSRLEIESCANQSVIGIVPDDSRFNNYIYLTMLNNIDDLALRQTGGAQQHINKNDVETFEVVVPNNIEEFDNKVSKIFEKISIICFQNKTLEQLRDTLLPKLMNGEIDLDNIEI